MPLSMMKRILGAVAKPTKMQLSLADRSITYPYGILHNVLVRCAKFVFPADFVILDIEENVEVPLLLGRPFLATGRILIDVEMRELMLRLDDEQVEVVEEVVKDAQEAEWDREIEIFLQQLDECPIEDTLLIKEEISNPVVQPQELLLSTLEDLVKEEVMKLFETGMMNYIPDSLRVNLVHLTPKTVKSVEDAEKKPKGSIKKKRKKWKTKRPSIRSYPAHVEVLLVDHN
ncbi:hypothetical protein A2U01_0023885, partial [Trifolium medium]|nr:hypothetical protein [Trifolium medium]